MPFAHGTGCSHHKLHQLAVKKARLATGNSAHLSRQTGETTHHQFPQLINNKAADVKSVLCVTKHSELLLLCNTEHYSMLTLPAKSFAAQREWALAMLQHCSLQT